MKTMTARIGAMAAAVIVIVAMVPGDAAARYCEYEQVCDAWARCVWRWLCY